MNQTSQKSHKKQQETLLCSVHVLTNFCLQKCIQPGQFRKMANPQTQKCVAECAGFLISHRLALKDKWVQDMTEVDENNQKIWAAFLDEYWK